MYFNHSGNNRFLLVALLLFTALLCIAAAPVPEEVPEEEPQMIKVTVAVFDYTAGSAELDAASTSGIVLAAKEVQVPAGSMAIEAVEAALQAEKISYTAPAGDYGKYLSEVNGLKEMDGGKESGWLFCLNKDFGNSGVAATEIREGDALELHYSIVGYGTDVGNYWDALPILTSFSLAGTKLVLSSETVYDEEWNAKTVYYVGEGENRRVLAGQGTAQDPFLLTITVADDLDLQGLTAEYSASLHPQYRQLLPNPATIQDYSLPVGFCLSTAGGILQSHYRVTMVKDYGVSYIDVTETDWAYSYIYDLTGRGIVKGNGDGTFGQQSNIKRCDFVTMLARMSGESLPEASAAFTDVPLDSYYAQAVSWALQAGITSGRSKASFAPNDLITREEIATMLYRYGKYRNIVEEKMDVERLGLYPDGKTTSVYALEAMEWSLDAGLLNGYTDGTLQPQAYATRAAVAKMLSRLLTFMEG